MKPEPCNPIDASQSGRWAVWVGVVLFFVCCHPGLSITNAPVKFYKLGDRATRDVFTRVPLYVLNAEETEAQRLKEIKRTSSIYRFEASALDRALGALGAEVVSTKAAFLDLIRSNYNTQVLAPQTVNGNGFKLVLNGFRRQNSKFPLSSEMAKTWAMNTSDASFLTDWTNHLTTIYAGYIRPDVLGEEFESSSGSLRILDPTQKGSYADLDEALKTSTSWPRTNALRVAKAQQTFQRAFTNEQAALGKFLAKFITNNLLLDTNLTRQYQVRRAQSIWVADYYNAGTRLVAAGEEVTPKIKRALDELALLKSSGRIKTKWTREKPKARLTQIQPDQPEVLITDVSPPESPLLATEIKPEVVSKVLSDGASEGVSEALSEAVPETQAGTRALGGVSKRGLGYWTALALGLGSVMALLVCAIRWRRSPKPSEQAMMPATTVLDEALQPITLTCPACQEPVPVHLSTLPVTLRWQERAIQAERRADAALALMRSKILPGLFQWAKSKLMRTLVSQRDQLEHNQWIAEKEINELVKRLDQVHTPMAGRLRAYEERITQLEELLRIKGEENRALLEARLQAVRRQLAFEQSSGTIAWN